MNNSRKVVMNDPHFVVIWGSKFIAESPVPGRVYCCEDYEGTLIMCDEHQSVPITTNLVVWEFYGVMGPS